MNPAHSYLSHSIDSLTNLLVSESIIVRGDSGSLKLFRRDTIKYLTVDPSNDVLHARIVENEKVDNMLFPHMKVQLVRYLGRSTN